MLTSRPAAAIALAVCACSASAALLVDTGTPPGGPTGASLYNEQSLGASFAVPVATTITLVEGFMRSTYGGALTVKLYAGAPGGSPLYTFAREVPATFDPRWESFGALAWAVQAGTYTLAFEPTTFSGYMTSPAPRPLDDEWNQTFNRPWTKIGGVDGLGIRVHVTAVPEPATWWLMASALGLAAATRLEYRRPNPWSGRCGSRPPPCP